MNKQSPTALCSFALKWVKEKYFYTCSVKFVEDPTPVYDWQADVMNDAFSIPAARKKLKALPDSMVCDALLNRDIFSDVGNIIKNEVLYRIQLDPEFLLGKMSTAPNSLKKPVIILSIF